MSSDKPPEFFVDRSLGHLFCLADGNATLDQIAQRFLDAMPAIHRAIRHTEVGFWHIHAGGRITRMWP